MSLPREAVRCAAKREDVFACHCAGNVLDITIQNTPAGLSRLSDLVGQFSREHSLPSEAERALALALHEHLSNVLAHGFNGPGSHTIEVRLRSEPGVVRAEVEDDGRPFNPLEHPEVDTGVPLEAKRLGGLGIHMVRKSMDGVEYRRSKGHNVLTLWKRLR